MWEAFRISPWGEDSNSMPFKTEPKTRIVLSTHVSICFDHEIMHKCVNDLLPSINFKTIIWFVTNIDIQHWKISKYNIILLPQSVFVAKSDREPIKWPKISLNQTSISRMAKAEKKIALIPSGYSRPDKKSKTSIYCQSTYVAPVKNLMLHQIKRTLNT